MKTYRIDWPNHLLSFVGTLLGIFIAFRIDDWKTANDQRDRLAVVIESIKNEVNSNRSIYRQNFTKFKPLVELFDLIKANPGDDDGNLLLTEREGKAMQEKYGEFFNRLTRIRRVRDSLSSYSFSFNLASPYTGISVSSWEAAKSSGILNYLDHERLKQLTEIYNWTEIDLGASDNELFANWISRLNEAAKFSEMYNDYKSLVRVSEFKYLQIEAAYAGIDWTVQ